MGAEEQPEGSSRAAGVCVLVVLGGVVDAAAWAVDEAAGILLLIIAGVVALWRSARHGRSVQDTANPAPPPGSAPPGGGEWAGHGDVAVTAREGMLIYSRPDRDNPARTHVRVEAVDDDPHD